MNYIIKLRYYIKKRKVTKGGEKVYIIIWLLG